MYIKKQKKQNIKINRKDLYTRLNWSSQKLTRFFKKCKRIHQLSEVVGVARAATFSHYFTSTDIDEVANSLWSMFIDNIKDMKFYPLILMTLFFSSCASYEKFRLVTEEMEIPSKIYKADYDQTWKAVVQVMKKYNIAQQNPEAGFIKTRWIDNTAFVILLRAVFTFP